MKYFLACFAVVLQFAQSDGILCYQCDDSTDDREKADCTYHIRRLGFHRHLLDTKERTIHELEFLKNCSLIRNEYDEEIFKYCKIEIIQSHGSTNAFLRGCSDGTNFASLNVTRLKDPRPDNQTTCGFSQLQGATQCIQLCTEDFCNGPFANPGNRVSPTLNLALLSVIVSIVKAYGTALYAFMGVL